MKILILKPSSLGDVVQALPVLRLLKLNNPAHEISWWLSSELLPLLQNDPDLHEIIPFDRQCWALPRCWRKHFDAIRSMRAKAFDWVIDLQGLARSGIFAWLAHGNLTIGIDDHREGARAFYDLLVPRSNFHSHAVDWYLEVLRALNVPVHWNFEWLPVHPEAAASVRTKWQAGQSRWVLMIPGARWPTKRWPLESYQTLVRLILSHSANLKVAILGTRAEASLGDAIARIDPRRCLDLTGRTSLPEMVEWIRLSDLVVCNDTGPMHIAAALQKPVVAIFGPTEPLRTGPYRQSHRTIQATLPCVPCFKAKCTNLRTMECLQVISASTVFQQVQQELSG
ncbi:MAG: lipopolysaccharide heptosyltransferase II [Verrucomicrobia bacterium]|nr:lipopolysaccharide heptosyltransferase II [Verrucomicrobiota bacterium]